MRLASFEGERRISDLVGRLYRISGPRAAARAREAQRALLEANPHLRELRRVPEGALIVVPDVPEAEPAGQRPEAPRPALEALAEALARGAEAVTASVAEQATRAEQEARALTAREIKAAARTAPGLEEALARAAAAAEERAKRARALRAESEQALAQLADDLRVLVESMGGGSIPQEGKPPRRRRG